MIRILSIPIGVKNVQRNIEAIRQIVIKVYHKIKKLIWDDLTGFGKFCTVVLISSFGVVMFMLIMKIIEG